MRKIYSILVVAALVCVMMLGWPSCLSYREGKLFSWKIERQKEVTSLTEAILDYAREHQGQLPLSQQHIVELGICDEDCFLVRDTKYGITITRKYRPVPDLSYPKEMIIMTEQYDKIQQYMNVCALDGICRVETNRHDLEKDNLKRKELGLEELR